VRIQNIRYFFFDKKKLLQFLQENHDLPTCPESQKSINKKLEMSQSKRRCRQKRTFQLIHISRSRQTKSFRNRTIEHAGFVISFTRPQRPLSFVILPVVNHFVAEHPRWASNSRLTVGSVTLHILYPYQSDARKRLSNMKTKQTFLRLLNAWHGGSWVEVFRLF
jgi:hypothetical protein